MAGASVLSVIAAIVVGTWNGHWFPSGRAMHRAIPAVEERTTAEAARMLESGMRAVDPAGTNDVILCLSEIRGPLDASNLIARIGRKGLRVVCVSEYRRRDRADWQQNVIATTLPVADARWRRWKRAGRKTPPRGYAYAAVVIDAATTASVYAVHLKSCYGEKSVEDAVLNRAKRATAISQIIEKERKGAGGPAIVAGDLNADRWKLEFVQDTIFGQLEAAGFRDALENVTPQERVTYPSKRFGDGTLDYVFFRGLEEAGKPHVVANDGLSDHFAVFVLLK